MSVPNRRYSKHPSYMSPRLPWNFKQPTHCFVPSTWRMQDDQ